MIGNCEACGKEALPVRLWTMNGMESVQCFRCVGDAEVDPYGELGTEISMTFTHEQNRLLEETHDQVRLPVKPWTIETAIEQVEKCGFEHEGGPLKNNDAWRWIVMTLIASDQASPPEQAATSNKDPKR